MPTRTATCPFCGLLCDDLVVVPQGDLLLPLQGACERSRKAFAKLGTPAAAAATARVGGKVSSLEAAFDAAAVLLRQSQRPLIGGLATDVAGMRATLTLARRIGAVVDHLGSSSKYRNLHVLQEAGWITTTLAEVKNRADLLMLIGDGWHTRFPRFVERALLPATDLTGSTLTRRIILLDEAASAAQDALPKQHARLAIGAPLAMLPELLSSLSARAAEQPVDRSRFTDTANQLVDQCIDWLRNARYGVVVWAAADLELPHAELTLHALSRLLRTLNRDRRFAGLPLAGTNGDLTANAVHTWQTGVPYPSSHANARIDFDPYRHATHAVLERREADCLLWISSLSEAAMPEVSGMPVIVLGRADTQFERQPDVFVPVGTPGIDADGHLVRTDKVISLYLKRLRSANLPSVAQAVDALSARLA